MRSRTTARLQSAVSRFILDELSPVLESLHDNQSKGPSDWNWRGRRRGFCFGSILLAAISQGLPAETVACRDSPYRRLRAKHSGFPAARIADVSPRRKGQDGCA